MAGPAEGAELLTQTVVLLGSAMVAALVFSRLGLGTVLGYLAAGIAIGAVPGVIEDGEDILHFAEIGIVFLLFLVGLELKPERLWALRVDIFGLGASQVIISGVLLGYICSLLGMDNNAAIIAGFGMALSSTAFALQLLADRNEMNTAYGQKSFSILLFQDLAIVPLLALVPLLAFSGVDGESLFSIGGILKPIAAIGILVLVGRYLLDPLLRVVAKTAAREAMLATALFVVLGAAWLMQQVGLSMALGAFVAGVLLADSAFRHHLEADIEPFRGLLLGLFFLACGLSLDLGVVLSNWYIILFAIPALMAIKAVVIFLLARLFGVGRKDALRIAAVLPQGGEFGFVLFTAAASVAVLSRQEASLLIAIATLSMALTPASVALGEKIMPRDKEDVIDEDFSDAEGQVIMVGFSRFGQVVSQVLLAYGTKVTIIDTDPQRIRQAAKFGFRIYFGDGSRPQVLRAAGISRAKAVVVATNGAEATNKVVDIVQSETPEAMVFARSYDRPHAVSLRKRNVSYEIRDTLGSALQLGEELLFKLGASSVHAREIMEDVAARDEMRLREQMAHGLNSGFEYLRTHLQPEPLSKPKDLAQPVDEASRSIVEDEEGEQDKTAFGKPNNNE